jgi:opacity protein-like surface antigen
MKKALAVLILAVSLVSSAQAATTTPVVISSDAVAPIWTALGFVTFGEFVIYANANGIPFPLCGVNGWKCYDEYPSGRKD